MVEKKELERELKGAQNRLSNTEKAITEVINFVNAGNKPIWQSRTMWMIGLAAVGKIAGFVGFIVPDDIIIALVILGIFFSRIGSKTLK